MNVLLAVVGVLGVSLSGPLMAGTNAPALAIAFWRNAFAEAVLVPVAAARRRDELRGLTRSDLRTCLVSGAALALHFATWVSALKLTSVAAAIALVSMQVAWVALIGRLRGEHVPVPVVVGLLIAIAGVVVITGVDLTLSADAVRGDLLALVGGFAAAVYTVAGGSARARLTTTTYTTLAYGICAVILLVTALVLGVDLVGFDSAAWAGIVGVTITAQLLGHSVLNHLLAVYSPVVVSLILLLEVPGAALLAAVLLGQAPAVGVYAGLALILAGLAVVVVRGRPRPEEVPLAE
ncbi:threonine/homoserine efflux transporter RhtA [Mumia flava]|uniref:Threonine/homoserine efflux transporter RhtA n=1 Tax=Mumia flava TaxID=1348852 RepID=A0A0B2B2N7_9ACTN|nr:DMT family transporter [Mumia flava]PJJ56700.1 threonine/homoserine efflux transporter RhtA [Mumia flava]